ncbi:flagellar hook-basal body complex protein [Clostridium septicum]|uniref:Flagellar basal body rod protein FlgG n=1 Tax=Clostridium septicum TaxID=1504 RepID=A0A9N7JIY4_CLOSE|nr:flagellar hook-basal body complex protein [Clostridium septicum]AYE33408.1 flagellar basal body rod protein FlgG [Clostridium septicum]MDU1313983.1 flagellar hook-basal body complex protein [Clostridium septicum]QAS61582.1 flagellar basal body rod protein FlgG [Clostridium septicum]UEC21982.1 flagellar basal body rod protein FlgG [Clostridium septicum]USR99986.1 flagellar hook-basal body complex protein [Clostridium septicum]
MLRTLWTGKSGMISNQERLDVISNNLANSTTVGYKKVEIGFRDLLMESLDRKGVPLNNKESEIGTGVRTSDWFRNDSQGNLLATTKPTDVAIDGNGYFKIIAPDGEIAYTRDGALSIDGYNRLVDNRGNKLEINFLPGFSEDNVKFTKDNFVIDKSGQLFINEQGTLKQVGEIPLYTAVGDKAFMSIGDNLFKPMPGSEVIRASDFNLYQGKLEASNVDIATEFADMIITQRAFELNSRGVKTADEMWGMVNNLRSK